jgi:phosphate-selective porin OprO/OprP
VWASPLPGEALPTPQGIAPTTVTPDWAYRGWTAGGPASAHPQPGGAAEHVTTVTATTEGPVEVDQLHNRLQEIQRRLEALEGKQPVAKMPQSKDTSAEKFTVQINGRVHADYINFAHQNDISTAAYGDLDDYFEFRRLYLGVEGTGYGVWRYRLQLNFEPSTIIRDSQGNRLAETDVVQIRDAFIEHSDVPLLGAVRLGNMKVPFSLDEMTSSRFISFMEKATPSEVFSPKRRVGIDLTNHSPSEVFGWSTGVFFETISQELKQRIDDDQGLHWGIRGWWSPIYTTAGRGVLHLGAGYVFTSDADGRVRFCAMPEVHEEATFLDTGNFPAEHVHRGNLEAAAVFGPLSFQSELFAVRTLGGDTSPDHSFYGAYVMGSYFITGEHRVYKRTTGTFDRIIPNTNFFWVRTPDGPRFGWGAWEVALRWSWIDLEDDALASSTSGQMHNITCGLNWYWNPHIRMMCEWIHSFTDLRSQAETAETDIFGLAWRMDF